MPRRGNEDRGLVPGREAVRGDTNGLWAFIEWLILTLANSHYFYHVMGALHLFVLTCIGGPPWSDVEVVVVVLNVLGICAQFIRLIMDYHFQTRPPPSSIDARELAMVDRYIKMTNSIASQIEAYIEKNGPLDPDMTSVFYTVTRMTAIWALHLHAGSIADPSNRTLEAHGSRLEAAIERLERALEQSRGLGV